jgi:hypothetical protein
VAGTTWLDKGVKIKNLELSARGANGEQAAAMQAPKAAIILLLFIVVTVHGR